MSQDHIRQRLVSEKNCRVEKCSHGNVHVSIGNLTLRMKPAEFKKAAKALWVAAQKLDDEIEEGAPANTLLC